MTLIEDAWTEYRAEALPQVRPVPELEMHRAFVAGAQATLSLMVQGEEINAAIFDQLISELLTGDEAEPRQ